MRNQTSISFSGVNATGTLPTASRATGVRRGWARPRQWFVSASTAQTDPTASIVCLIIGIGRGEERLRRSPTNANVSDALIPMWKEVPSRCVTSECAGRHTRMGEKDGFSGSVCVCLRKR